MGLFTGFQKVFSYTTGERANQEQTKTKSESVVDPGGAQFEGSIHKTFLPRFLYKPPFGWPRTQDTILLRKLSQNAYIQSIISTIQYQVSSAKYEFKLREGKKENEEVKTKLENFFANPNGNAESFDEILRQLTRDILVLDSGVLVKVFNSKRELLQIFARDGASFLKNPDIHGYIGDREDFVDSWVWMWNEDNMAYETKPRFEKTADIQIVSNEAAYFQYGISNSSIPIPFGKREIIWFCANPGTDRIYGLSPVEILGNVLLTLIYGSAYNMDFYLNSNMPDGILELLNASKSDIEAFRERMKPEFTEKDALDNERKVFHRFPIVNVPTKFTAFQLTSRDMEILAQQEWFWKIVLAVFNVTSSEMGFTQDSNKATEVVQSSVFKRKAIAPLLRLIEYRLNLQIIPELDPEGLYKFCFDDYDIVEDIKKHELYQMQLNIGTKTSEMIAEEEGIDLEKLKKQKEEARTQRMEEQKATFGDYDSQFPKKGEKKKSDDGFGGQNTEKNNDKEEAKVKSSMEDGNPVEEDLGLEEYFEQHQTKTLELAKELDFDQAFLPNKL